MSDKLESIFVSDKLTRIMEDRKTVVLFILLERIKRFSGQHVRSEQQYQPFTDMEKKTSKAHVREDIDVFLMRALETLGKVHEVLTMRAPNKARSIAKLSNDICMIYMAIHESGCLQGFARPQIRNPTKCEFIPDPLGDHLAKDLSDIYMYDARMRYYDDTQNLKAKTNTDFLKDLDGAELIDVMLAMTGPWGMSRFEDILHLHRKAGPELWNSFKTIYEKMRFWDKDLFQIPVPHIGNEVFEVPSERTKRRIIELKGPPEVPSERASRESWAKIEAKVSKIEISDTRIVQEPHASNFSGHLRDTANEMEVRKERDSQVQVRYGLNPNTSEAKHAQLRVVFVSNFSEKASMKAISKRIKEGALLSLMMYKLPSDNVMVCCIVFDMAQHAKDFIERNKVLEKTSGQNRFGKGSRICLGAPWPEDDEIRFMHAEGGGQRRRLTFACSGLFRRLPYSVFKQEIEKAAGPKNVELIWRLNAGNATVIFASTQVARHVKATFTEMAKTRFIYEGLRVDYCADPCEKELFLTTKMQEGPEATDKFRYAFLPDEEWQMKYDNGMM